MTRKQGFVLLERLGYYREAVEVLKTGNLLCSLTPRSFFVGSALAEFGCKSNISGCGRYERFIFSNNLKRSIPEFDCTSAILDSDIPF